MTDIPGNDSKIPAWRQKLKSAFDAAKKTGRAAYDQAAKKAKVVMDDAAKHSKETLDTLSVLVNEDTPAGEKPRDLTLQERVDVAKRHLGKTEWLKVASDTAQDLTKKEELKKLAGTVIALPGGLAVYGAYRVAKHRKEKLEEEAKARQKKAKRTRKPRPPQPPAAA